MAASQIFRTMETNQAQEIREAYYKAVEGLMTLAEALEIADAQSRLVLCSLSISMPSKRSM